MNVFADMISALLVCSCVLVAVYKINESFKKVLSFMMLYSIEQVLVLFFYSYLDRLLFLDIDLELINILLYTIICSNIIL